MKKVVLKGKNALGKIALIDNADFERVNKYSWNVNNGGYAIHIHIAMHRFIMNTPKGMDTDHINGNRLDNRKKNLRICSRSQNHFNRKKRANTSSVYKGVYWKKDRGKWRAVIIFNKPIHIGYFTSEIDAAKSYNVKALELYGEFAKLNQI